MVPPWSEILTYSVCVCACRLSYLQKHTSDQVADLREERWQPLAFYRGSLLAEGDDAASHGSSDRKQPGRSKSKLEGVYVGMRMD